MPVAPSTLSLRSGARFYSCALQINPFAYLARHAKSTSFSDEDSYNEAVVEACLGNGIEVVGVTDHYRIKSSRKLIEAAGAAGLIVLPGFEAVTKDGVHFICLFGADAEEDIIERRIGECGIGSSADPSPIGDKDALEFMDCCSRWKAVCVAAHVAAAGGLLKTLRGQSAINAWRFPHLLACGLPGPVSDAPVSLRPILENKNPQYARERPVAVINAQDVNDPADLGRPGFSTAIKMSEVGFEGLKQAFLDPESRIRLPSDPEPQEHTEFVALEWTGGFLDGAAIHFNENLNALIGGRGTDEGIVELGRIGEATTGLQRSGEAGVEREASMPRSRRHTSHDVVIVGGGALGLACAWRTAQRGMDVCVLERGRPGGAASHAAAGMLAPVTEADFGEQELLELSLAAARAYPVFVEELEQAGGLEVGYRRCGALQVALDRDEATELRRLHGLQLAFGLEAAWLRPRRCRELERGLSTACAGAIHAPGEAQVDPRALTRALLAAVERAGGTVLAGAEVTGALLADSRLAGVKTADGARYPAGQVVLASGCWSGQARWLPEGARPPVRPVKGQILRLRGRADEPLCEGIVRTPSIYVVSRGDGRAVLGATVGKPHAEGGGLPPPTGRPRTKPAAE